MTAHLRQRMAERGIGESDINHALRHPQTVDSTPENSTRIVGKPDLHGRRLKVWIVGTNGWPRNEPETILKSAAWKDE